MLHPSTQQLIRKLVELTEAGQIGWTEGEGKTLRLAAEGYIVELGGDEPGLRLLQKDGRVLEAADAALLRATGWDGHAGNFADKVSEMTVLAARKARGIDDAISRILSALSAPPRTETPAGAPAPTPEPAPQSAPPAPSSFAAEPAAKPDARPTTEPEPTHAPAEAAAPMADPTPARRTAAAFGAIRGFARTGGTGTGATTASRQATPANSNTATTKVTSTGLLLTGFSARSVQTAQPGGPRHPAGAAPRPNRPAGNGAATAGVYKPWG